MPMLDTDRTSEPGGVNTISATSDHEETDRVHVLVVEDDTGNRVLLRRVLEDAGYTVSEATDGPAALKAMSQDPISLVVLDLGLPGVDGVEVLERVRRGSGVPILVLTGRAEEAEKLRALDAGADDYVVKPYSLAELTARARALLRRGNPTSIVEQLEFDGLRIDMAARAIAINGSAIDVTPKEFELLAFLAASGGRCFTREELLQHVWASTDDWQQAATVTEHIRRLRVKIDADRDNSWIETVRGLGYRFRTDG